MIEIHTVGRRRRLHRAGRFRGALVVGPQSAGADPGPACYGTGEQVTVTDANLVLGRIRADRFLGGRMKPGPGTGAAPAGRDWRRRIGADVETAALGIVRVVNANMERAIRAISLERGYDPRRFTLVPFGGAGPMHSCELAAALGIPRVLVPTHPGILSALGVAVADVVKDYSRTVMLRGDDLDRDRLEEEFHGMENGARSELRGEGLPADRMTARRFPGRAVRGAVVRADGGLSEPPPTLAGRANVRPAPDDREQVLPSAHAAVRVRGPERGRGGGEPAAEAGVGGGEAAGGAAADGSAGRIGRGGGERGGCVPGGEVFPAIFTSGSGWRRGMRSWGRRCCCNWTRR